MEDSSLVGRIYAIPYTGTITAAGTDTDLLSLQPADDKPVKLRGVLLSQISETGDTQEEGLRLTLRRLAATFTVGTGGTLITAATPTHDSADPVWGFVARCNDTTVATTSGLNDIKVEVGWLNRQSPYELWFPDERFGLKVKQGEGLIVRLETTLLDDMTGCFTFWVEEE
jgi:hypothetical protein